MYKTIAGLLWIIRQFFIPNPFEVLGEGITISISNFPILLTPDLLNWIVGFILPALTYFVVGLYYESKSNPVLGSVLYMLFYITHVTILHLLSTMYPNNLLIATTIIIYISINIIAHHIKANIRY